MTVDPCLPRTFSGQGRFRPRPARRHRQVSRSIATKVARLAQTHETLRKLEGPQGTTSAKSDAGWPASVRACARRRGGARDGRSRQSR